MRPAGDFFFIQLSNTRGGVFTGINKRADFRDRYNLVFAAYKYIIRYRNIRKSSVKEKEQCWRN